MPIVYFFYMGYSKFLYALLDFKKVVIFIYFDVMIYIEYEFFNYVPCQLEFLN